MSRAAIIGESCRVEERVGIALVTGKVQKTARAGEAVAAGGIATQIVALRSNCAGVVDDVCSAYAGLENIVAELQHRRATIDSGRDVDTAAAGAGGVLAESATADAQHCVAVFAVDVNGAAIAARRVLAEGAIGDAAHRAARIGIVLDSARVEAG